MSNSTIEQEVTNQDPSVQDPTPLRPDLDAWKGFRVVGESAVARILGLDTDRLVPAGAILAICFSVAQQADWIPYASIVAIALGAMLAQKGSGNRASAPIESTKDPPQSRGLQIRARADGTPQG